MSLTSWSIDTVIQATKHARQIKSFGHTPQGFKEFWGLQALPDNKEFLSLNPS
jgi:hypothetical protein